MFKKSVVKTTALAAIMAGAASIVAVPTAMAHPADDSVYVIDGRKNVVLSGSKQCWRDGYWTPAAAARDKNGCACDQDLLRGQCGARPPVARAPAPTPKAAPQRPVVTSFSVDTLFAFASSRMSSRGRAALDKFLNDSRGASQRRYLLVTGHADRIGSARSNMRLSQRRANNVKSYLVSRGVAANRIYTEGRGEAESNASNECRNMGRDSSRNKRLVACLAKFRRVDVTQTDSLR